MCGTGVGASRNPERRETAHRAAPLRLRATYTRDEVLAWHTTGGASNGPTEANLSIKHVKRVGRGFRRFENYRIRLLLHCGGVVWHDQPAARL